MCRDGGRARIGEVERVWTRSRGRDGEYIAGRMFQMELPGRRQKRTTGEEIHGRGDGGDVGVRLEDGEDRERERERERDGGR